MAFNYRDTYNLCRGELLSFNGEKTVGLYDFVHDKMLKENLLKAKPEVVNQMEIQMKAIIQQYNNRLIENQAFGELGKLLIQIIHVKCPNKINAEARLF